MVPVRGGNTGQVPAPSQDTPAKRGAAESPASSVHRARAGPRTFPLRGAVTERTVEQRSCT